MSKNDIVKRGEIGYRKIDKTGDEQMNINHKYSFSKVPRRKLVDEVLEQLQERIFSGEYEVGDRLPTEPQLMEEF